jgi:antitoxin component YwqK of YwqJK toxin-antitoxin module
VTRGNCSILLAAFLASHLRRGAFMRPRSRLIVVLAAVSILPGLAVLDARAGDPVPVAPLVCPDGGYERGDAPPRAHARWCERSSQSGMQRHGPYATWYPSGARQEEGEYRDGLKHGRWTVWTAQGSKESEGEYRGGLQHGRWTIWEHAERAEGEYRDGLREGVWTTWSDNGVKLAEGPYVSGRKQGVWTQWNPDGSKWEEAEFAANQRRGRWVAYQGGVKTFEGAYRNDLPDGRFTTWHPNGQKAGEADFLGGRPSGPFMTWHPNGQKSAEGRYGNDGPEGDFTFWDTQGRRRIVLRFADGRVIEFLVWDGHGRAITDDVERRAERDAYFDGDLNPLLILLAFLGPRVR